MKRDDKYELLKETVVSFQYKNAFDVLVKLVNSFGADVIIAAVHHIYRRQLNKQQIDINEIYDNKRKSLKKKEKRSFDHY